LRINATAPPALIPYMNAHTPPVTLRHAAMRKSMAGSSRAQRFFVCLLESQRDHAASSSLVICLLVHPPRCDDEVCQLPEGELKVLGC
jgi:hypothetical protein